jgi:asparagine synthase (glutamine-hydrolysing)
MFGSARTFGGIVGPHAESQALRLRAALGAGAEFLEPELGGGRGALLVSADACFIDGVPLVDAPSWQAVLRDERLADVDGAFAIAWVGERGGLRLARDPIGHRSLYFAVAERTLAFASRLQALVQSGFVPAELDVTSVAAYLSCAYVPGSATLVRGVRAVLGGEQVEFRDGCLERRRFWSVPAEPGGERSEAELLTSLRALLRGAVERRLPPAGQPVAASLSGGIDSSAVVALLRELHSGPVFAYSVSFGPEYRNELEWSALVAAHCGVQREVVEIRPPDVLADLDATTAALSEPNGDPLTVPNSMLFRRAAERSSVLFNGEGGDPCFGGPKNAPMLLAELFDDGPPEARARERSYLRAHQKCFDELREMLRPELEPALAEQALESMVCEWFDDARWPTLLNKLMAVNVAWKGAHHILPKVDQLSARFGVAPRSPLFDRRLVELSFEIPGVLKRRGAEEKYLLKRAVDELLPRSVIERPKSGMMVPVEAWFQGALLPAARERILDGLGRLRIFENTWLERLLDGRLRGLRPRRGVKIWLLVTLESWMRSISG